jgi:hypothetical protein
MTNESKEVIDLIDEDHQGSYRMNHSEKAFMIGLLQDFKNE